MRRILSVALAALFCVAPAIANAASRVIVYPGQNPLAEQTNQEVRFHRLAFGTWMRDALGSNTAAGGVYSNLSVVPNGGMYVAVQPTQANTLGSLYQVGVDDANPLPNGTTWTPTVAADSTKIVLQGLQSAPSGSLGPIVAPASGLQQYYLVEAQLQTVDTASQAITFINSNRTSSTQTVNTQRVDQIVYQLKSGTASSSPAVPSVDSGWIPIATVLVPSGASAISSAMISAQPSFQGFVANGSNVTLSGLTLSGASAGCLQTNSSGSVSVQACTSGLGSVVGTSPITANTVNGVATVQCTTCVTNVTASGNLSSSGGTTPAISISANPSFTNVQSTTQTLSGNSTIGNAGTATSSTNYGALGAFQVESDLWNGTSAVQHIWGITADNTGTLSFQWDATPKFTLNSSGSAAIGANFTPASGTTLEVRSLGGLGNEALKISGANASQSDQATIRIVGQRSDANTSGAFSGTLALAHWNTAGVTGSGTNVGRILFGGNQTDATEGNILFGAEIAGVAEGAYTNSTTMPTAISFRTGSSGSTASSGDAGTEVARFTSSGNLNMTAGGSLVSGSSTYGATSASVNGSVSATSLAATSVSSTFHGSPGSGASGGYTLSATGNGAGSAAALFLSTGSPSDGIRVTGSGASYSDPEGGVGDALKATGNIALTGYIKENSLTASTCLGADANQHIASSTNCVHSLSVTGPITNGGTALDPNIACATCLTTAGGQTISASDTFSNGVSFGNGIALADDGSGSHGININTASGSALGVRFFNGAPNGSTQIAQIDPSGVYHSSLAAGGHNTVTEWNNDNSGYTSIAANSSASVQSYTCDVWLIYSSNPSANQMCINDAGNLGVRGNVTAANFFNGSRRSYKFDIHRLNFDALGVLKSTDWASYRYKPKYGDPKEKKIGFIADDTPAILSGQKHDHFDAGALATVDAQAILQLAKRVDGLESMVKRLCREKKNRKEAACRAYVSAH